MWQASCGLAFLAAFVYFPRGRIKLVVGEIKELEKIPFAWRSRNGFYSFITAVSVLVDTDTGELDLDDDAFRKITRYKRSGYKKRLVKIFGRTLGPDLTGPPLV